MNAFSALRRSAPMALLVHALRAFSASLSLWPLTSALQRELALRVASAELTPGDAALLLQVAAEQAGGLLSWAASTLALHVLLAPFLGLMWLHAMRHQLPISQLAARALRSYVPALVVGLAAALSSLLALTPAALLLALAPGLFPHSEALQALARAGAGLAALLGWMAVTTAHDRARAALTRSARTPLASFRRALRSLAWRDVALRSSLLAACAMLAIAAEFAARATSRTLAPWAVAIEQQLILMPATVLQGLWLARTLARQPLLPRSALNQPRS